MGPGTSGLLAAAAVALGGCQLVFGLEGTNEDDPPIPKEGCHGSFPAAQVELDLAFETPTPAFFDPSLSNDADELWFAATEEDQNIYVTRRTGPGSPYVDVERASFTTSAREFEPSLTFDGQLMFFLSDRDSGDRLYQVSRPDRTSDFGADVTQPILDGFVSSLELSADGLTLYFVDSNMLFAASRTGRDQAFGQPKALGLQGSFPTITGDELEIFFQDESAMSTVIRRAVRPNKDSAFVVQPIFEGGELLGIDPEVSADGTRLVYGSQGGGGFFELTRSCL